MQYFKEGIIMREYKRRSRIAAFLLLAVLFVSCISTLSISAAVQNVKGANNGNGTKDIKLIPGGIPFGVKFLSEGVIILSSERGPAAQAGLKPRDIIIKVNGKSISGVDGLRQALAEGGGATVSITYMRDGREHKTSITPIYSRSDGEYKIGAKVKDSGAGLGTVTYIVPSTLEFAGLGHGICDSETGELIPMSRGVITDITVSGVKKGVSGTPGEIKGYFGSNKIGSLYKNTSCGVYGMFTQMPKGVGEACSICTKDDIVSGEAYIICTLDRSGPQKYRVQIGDIDRSAQGSKCFSIKVDDEKLIGITGGIVQGMSGSPVMQNGRLAGAVTHVLINDPSSGYGIFIENMLNAA